MFISLNEKTITEDDIDSLLKIKDLNNIRLVNCKFEGNTLSDIFSLDSVTSLTLDSCSLNDEDLALVELNGGSKLASLSLNGNEISDLEFLLPICNTLKYLYIDENNVELLKRLIKFFNLHPNFFKKLTEDKRIKIDGIIKKDTKHDLKALALFEEENSVEHIFKASFTQHKTGIYLFQFLYLMVNKQMAFDYGIKLYASSASYDEADWRFEDFIQPYLKNFSIEQLRNIVEAVNNNDQLHGRMRAVPSNNIIRKRILSLEKSFDFSLYPYFRY